jgi:hypothetical protein
VMPEIPGLSQMTTRRYLLGISVVGSRDVRQLLGLPN